MIRGNAWQRVTGALAIIGLMIAGASLWAAESQQPAPPDRQAAAAPQAADETPQDSDAQAAGRSRRPATSRWGLFGRGSWSRVRARSHATVRSAFREVVKGPSASTAQVKCDGEQVALGTVVSADGYILTKASELEAPVQCLLADGRLLDADVVGIEPQYDLAMLKVDADDLVAIEWSEGDAPPLGSWVATPGMTDIPIGIGVVSVSPRAIAAPSAVLGVFLDQAEQGPKITAVNRESAAEKAGLKVDDLVMQVNGRPVETKESLIQTVRQSRPGDKLRLSVQRGDQHLEIVATLGGWPPESREGQPGFQESLGGPLSGRRAGFPVVLQHDTVLTPRACGGPLVDLDGKTIGINIARADRVATYALPASAVKSLLDELRSGKLAPAMATQNVSSTVVQNGPSARQAAGDADRGGLPLGESNSPAADGQKGGAESSLSAPRR